MMHVKMVGRTLWGAMVILIFVAGPLFGGTITLTTSSTSSVLEDRVKIEVTAINSGDETAERARMTMFFEGEISKSPVRLHLAPGESFTVRFPIIIPPGASGAYTALILVDFHDVKGYPFSALSYTSFAVGPVALPEVFAKPVDVTIKKHGSIQVEIENTAQRRLPVKVKLAAPRELHREPESMEVEIPPGKSRTAEFSLEKWMAREGAIYHVLTMIEYEDDGRHYTSVTENRVRVAAQVPFFKAYLPVLIFINLCLIALVIWIEVQIRQKGPAFRKERFCD